MERLLVWPIAIPAAAALVTLFLSRRASSLAAFLAVLATLGTLAAGGFLLDKRGSATFSLFAMGNLDLTAALRVDAFSGWAVAFVGLLSLLVALYAAGWYRGRGGAPGRFHGFLLLATAGAVIVLLADHLLVFVVGWELVTLSLFFLALAGREEGGPGAAKAFVLLGLGDLALLVGMVLVGLHHEHLGYADPWSIATLRTHPLDGGATGAVAWLLLFAAAAAKAGAMPLHSWIPTLSTGTNQAVMAFLPGSVDKVLGIYLLARLSLTWGDPGPTLRTVVMVVGAVTILGAVFMAMVQHDLRRLLSFHAVSQVGYMLLGIGTGTVIGVLGGVFHMVNHAIYKACLFLGAGSVEREAGTMELSRLGGLARTMPVTFGCMFVAALAISGIPPMNGFVSKWYVYQACVAVNSPLLLVAAIFGSALTLASFVKVLHSVFWGPRPSARDGVAEGSGGIGMPIAMITLAALCVVLGVLAPWVSDTFLGPVVGLEPGAAIRGSAALAGAPATWAGVDGAASARAPAAPAVYAPLPVTGLLVLGFLVALLLAYMGHARARRVRGVFVGGQPFNRNVNRFPGTEFYRTVQDLPVVGRALRVGSSGRLDPWEVAIWLGTPVQRGLRRLHRGLATDYIVFVLLGTVVLLVVLVLGR